MVDYAEGVEAEAFPRSFDLTYDDHGEESKP